MAFKSKMTIHKTRDFSAEFPFDMFRVPHFSNISTRIHKREFWKITYIISGKGSLYVNGKVYPVAPGLLFLVHPDDETTYIIDKSERIDACNILFLPEMLSPWFNDVDTHSSFLSIFNPRHDESLEQQWEQLYIFDSTREISTLIKRIEHEWELRDYNYRMVIKGLLLELLALAMRLSARKQKSYGKPIAIDYIDSVIKTEYSKNIDYDDLAKKIGLSKSYLWRLYKKTRGRSIGKSLLSMRLNMAKEMLANNPKSTISSICFECGFNDLPYFFRAFRKIVGMTPSDFRKSIGLE